MSFAELKQGFSSLADHFVIEQFLRIGTDWKEEALFFAITLSFGYVIGRYIERRARSVSVYQNRGEALLSNIIQTNFDPPDYHLMNHMTIQLEDGTTQVDHILVSRFGVFVIETKDYSGWIFASEGSANWTQVFFKKKFRFQSPIFQNSRHVRAVRGLLDFLPPEAITSVVVFTGEAEFKTETPSGVYNLPNFIEFISNKTVEVMSLNRVQFCVGRLETARLAISGQTDIEHVRSLERRHGNV
ncbi:MAG: nuclease-related domain-containing protein [Gammaproteobacteria bacterium]